jgi:TonB family protein
MSARFSYTVPPSGTGKYLVNFGVDGRAASVAIVQSAGNSVLDTAAVEALRSWRAKPGLPSRRTVPITFHRPN